MAALWFALWATLAIVAAGAGVIGFDFLARPRLRHPTDPRWRPICWLLGHLDDHHTGECERCAKDLDLKGGD